MHFLSVFFSLFSCDNHVLDFDDYRFASGSQRGPPPLVPADQAMGKGNPGPPNVTVSQGLNVGLTFRLVPHLILFVTTLLETAGIFRL